MTSSKRPAEDAETPTAKRARLNPDASLPGLPPELKIKILRDLVLSDADDPQRALPNAMAFAHTNQSLRAVVNNEFQSETVRSVGGRKNRLLRELARKSGDVWILSASSRISGLISRIGRGNNSVKGIPFPFSGSGFDDVTLKNIVLQSEFVALQPTETRFRIVRDALAMPAGSDKADALHGLVGSLGHLDYDDRVRLVDHICRMQQDEGGAEALVKAAIERSGHLQPRELSALARVALTIEDPEAQRDCLLAFAGRMSPLDVQDQRDVLHHVIADDDGKVLSLGTFAARLDDVSPEHRPLIANAILDLPTNQPGRLWAISGLSAHLDLLDVQTEQPDHPMARHVAVEILNNTERPHQEPANDDLPWNAEPSLCAVEAIHHLATHRHLLSEDDVQRTDNAIRSVLEARAPDWARQAQLIPHMDDIQRENFVATALEEGAEPETEGRTVGTTTAHVAAALTLRMRSLSDDERTTFVSYVCGPGREDTFLLHDALDHNIKTRLDCFSEDQRTDLISERLDAVTRHDTDSGVQILRHVTGCTELMNVSDVNAVLRVVTRETPRATRDGDEEGAAAAREMAVLSAQAVADWSTRQVYALTERSGQSMAKATVTQASRLERATYDERPGRSSLRSLTR